MDRRPKGPFQPLHGTQDNVLRELMYKLIRGAANGQEYDAMRTESLFVELGTRLLFVSRLLPQEEPPTDSHFPRHLLRRVLDRMHEELDSGLSLSALAAESGYSRAHFMRIFKATMGVTPHIHLLELRLQRAQKMLTSASMSLIDIALACGFRSHAHFTTTFTRRFGVALASIENPCQPHTERAEKETFSKAPIRVKPDNVEVVVAADTRMAWSRYGRFIAMELPVRRLLRLGSVLACAVISPRAIYARSACYLLSPRMNCASVCGRTIRVSRGNGRRLAAN